VEKLKASVEDARLKAQRLTEKMKDQIDNKVRK
jgi:hypothetical protein